VFYLFFIYLFNIFFSSSFVSFLFVLFLFVFIFCTTCKFYLTIFKQLFKSISLRVCCSVILPPHRKECTKKENKKRKEKKKEKRKRVDG